MTPYPPLDADDQDEHMANEERLKTAGWELQCRRGCCWHHPRLRPEVDTEEREAVLMQDFADAAVAAERGRVAIILSNIVATHSCLDCCCEDLIELIHQLGEEES